MCRSTAKQSLDQGSPPVYICVRDSYNYHCSRPCKTDQGELLPVQAFLWSGYTAAVVLIAKAVDTRFLMSTADDKAWQVARVSRAFAQAAGHVLMEPHARLALAHVYHGDPRPSRFDSKLLLTWAPLITSLTMGAGPFHTLGFKEFLKRANHLVSVTASCHSSLDSANLMRFSAGTPLSHSWSAR